MKEGAYIDAIHELTGGKTPLKVFVDYGVSKECRNTDSYGITCLKCGKRGRKFDNGFMVDDGGTHNENHD